MTKTHAEATDRPEWIHLGNTAAHFEDYECSGCGRLRVVSNRSEQYQRAGEPEPCGCHEGGAGDQ